MQHSFCVKDQSLLTCLSVLPSISSHPLSFHLSFVPLPSLHHFLDINSLTFQQSFCMKDQSLLFKPSLHTFPSPILCFLTFSPSPPWYQCPDVWAVLSVQRTSLYCPACPPCRLHLPDLSYPGPRRSPALLGQRKIAPSVGGSALGCWSGTRDASQGWCGNLLKGAERCLVHFPKQGVAYYHPRKWPNKIWAFLIVSISCMHMYMSYHILRQILPFNYIHITHTCMTRKSWTKIEPN